MIKNVYKIKSYTQAPKTQKPEKIQNLEELKNLLETDNHLNEKYNGDDVIKIVFDFDNKGDEIQPIIDSLRYYFLQYFNLDISISYTENFKKFLFCGSYHIIINNVSCKVSTLNYIIKDYNNKNDYEADESIYRNGINIFRLPNQTTTDAKGKIKHGHNVV